MPCSSVFLGIAVPILVLVPSLVRAAPVDASVDIVPLPGCNLPLPPNACVAKYEPGSIANPGDDVVEALVIFADIHAHAEVPGAPSGGVVLDYNESYIPNPLFPEIEDVFRDVNDSLPSAVKPLLTFNSGTACNPTQCFNGFWIRIDACSALPVAKGPCAVNPGYWYDDNFTTRDRIYPLADGGTGTPFSTDAQIDWSADLVAMCLPEETAFAPAVCAPQASLARQLQSTAKAATPDIIADTGIQRIGATTNDGPGGFTRGWSVGQGSMHGVSPNPGTASRAVLPGGAPVPPARFIEPAIPPSSSGVAGAESGNASVSSKFASPELLGRQDSPVWLAAGAAFLGAVALYRRLRRDRLLEQPTRRAVMDLVHAHPGVTPAAVAKGLDVSYKTALHHAELLVEDGLLTVRLVGRERRLFPASRAFGQAERERRVVLQRPGVQRLLRSLPADSPVPRREIAARAGLGRTAAWRSLRALREAGLVAVEGTGPGAAVRLTTPAALSAPDRGNPGEAARP